MSMLSQMVRHLTPYSFCCLSTGSNYVSQARQPAPLKLPRTQSCIVALFLAIFVHCSRASESFRLLIRMWPVMQSCVLSDRASCSLQQRGEESYIHTDRPPKQSCHRPNHHIYPSNNTYLHHVFRRYRSSKKAAGQLQQDQAELTGSSDLKQSGHTDFQHGKGIENAAKETGAAG